ncbi:MAG TPA: YtxH domain-containing protein [Thermomicrobiaceae bacterium]|nr:YtxH domain-containing protein [Thermomicrobiaceae bacterium]
MLARTRVALKFMTYGVLLGVLFAPRSGSQTRQEVMGWAKSNLGGMLGGLGIGSQG